MLGTTSYPSKPIVLQVNSIYFQICKASHHKPPHPLLKKDFCYLKELSNENSVMRNLWPARTNRSLWVKTQVGIHRPSGGVIRQRAKLGLQNWLSCPPEAACVPQETHFLPHTLYPKRSVMFDGHLKLMWFPYFLTLAGPFAWRGYDAQKDAQSPFLKTRAERRGGLVISRIFCIFKTLTFAWFVVPLLGQDQPM